MAKRKKHVPKKKPYLSKKAVLQLKQERDWYRDRYEAAVNARKKETAARQIAEARIATADGERAAHALANLSLKQKNQDLMNYITLRRPDVLKLIRLIERQRAFGSAGVGSNIVVNVAPKRRPPRVN